MGNVVRLSELSKARQSEWIDRLFSRFAAMYGARFADFFEGMDLAVVKAVWAEDLSAMTTDEVARGVEAAKSLKFPPTLPEFMALCRPGLDPEAAFAEAVAQMRCREEGGDSWSHPAIFWAAASVGAFDLRNASWSSIKGRWSRILLAEMAKGEWPAVPPKRVALPATGGKSATPETLARVSTVLRRASKLPSPAECRHAWLRIRDRVERGERVPSYSRQLAEEALGERFVVRGKALRPDVQDRIAGDDSFDAVVPL